jgi:hypothetical protein
MGRTAVELRDEGGQLLLLQGTTRAPIQATGSTQLVATLPNGSPQRLHYRLADGSAEYLYLGSRALARQPAP